MKLSQKTNVIVQPERLREVEELVINRIMDFPDKRQVKVTINELPVELVLWEGDDYDLMCAWTLEDVEKRIEELLV